jgi:hypothetical protein
MICSTILKSLFPNFHVFQAFGVCMQLQGHRDTQPCRGPCSNIFLHERSQSLMFLDSQRRNCLVFAEGQRSQGGCAGIRVLTKPTPPKTNRLANRPGSRRERGPGEFVRRVGTQMRCGSKDMMQSQLKRGVEMERRDGSGTESGSRQKEWQ